MNGIRIYYQDEFLGDRDLSDDVKIGRHRTCDLTLDKDGISRQHARIFRKGSHYYVEDLGSVNGTFLGSSPVRANEPVELADQDEVSLGHELYTLKLRITDAPEQTEMLSESDLPVQEAPAVPEPPTPPPEPKPLMSHLVEGLSNIPVWSEGIWNVVVQEVVDETSDTKTFRFGGQEPVLFSYQPGQFITLQLEIDGDTEMRSYTISSSPSRPHALEITVKRVKGGKVSNWLHDNVKTGDEITIVGPSGSFSCFSYPTKKLLFIGAGSGMTPLMSMSRWILDTAADVDVRFLVSARTPDDIIFRKDLELMSARHKAFNGAVTITSGWSGTQSWLGLTGRVDLDMIKMVAPDFMERHAFMCGPNPFMAAVTDILSEGGYPIENLHTESFGEGRVAEGSITGTDLPSIADLLDEKGKPKKAKKAKKDAAPPVEPAPAALAPDACGVTFQKSNMSKEGEPNVAILNLAEQVGVKIPYSCRSGACGQCKVKLVNGKVHEKADAIQRVAKMLPDGFVLSCVDCPDGAVTVDA